MRRIFQLTGEGGSDTADKVNRHFGMRIRAHIPGKEQAERFLKHRVHAPFIAMTRDKRDK